MPAIPHESHLRSLLKGLTWRVIATATIVALAWWKTGDISFALELGALEFVIKLLLYYGHERAWALVPTGALRLSSIRRRRSMRRSRAARQRAARAHAEATHTPQANRPQPEPVEP